MKTRRKRDYLPCPIPRSVSGDADESSACVINGRIRRTESPHLAGPQMRTTNHPLNECHADSRSASEGKTAQVQRNVCHAAYVKPSKLAQPSRKEHIRPVALLEFEETEQNKCPQLLGLMPLSPRAQLQNLLAEEREMRKDMQAEYETRLAVLRERVRHEQEAKAAATQRFKDIIDEYRGYGLRAVNLARAEKVRLDREQRREIAAREEALHAEATKVVNAHVGGDKATAELEGAKKCIEIIQEHGLLTEEISALFGLTLTDSN
eukprot:Polyplicarium_translucidae@DN4822_c0_g1_i1.p1